MVDFKFEMRDSSLFQIFPTVPATVLTRFANVPDLGQ